MASEAQRNMKRLEEEKAKPYPNSDIIYYLEQTRPYWNTIDTDKMHRGAQALQGESSLAKLIGQLPGGKS